jgi:hypothetical protein
VSKKEPVVNHKQSSQGWFIRHRLALGIVVFVLLLDIFVTGFMKFGYYVVKCGGAPVKVTHYAIGWGGSTLYNTPGHYLPGGSTATYYCTEQQASNTGAVKDLYQ